MPVSVRVHNSKLLLLNYYQLNKTLPNKTILDAELIVAIIQNSIVENEHPVKQQMFISFSKCKPTGTFCKYNLLKNIFLAYNVWYISFNTWYKSLMSSWVNLHM